MIASVRKPSILVENKVDTDLDRFHRPYDSVQFPEREYIDVNYVTHEYLNEDGGHGENMVRDHIRKVPRNTNVGNTVSYSINPMTNTSLKNGTREIRSTLSDPRINPPGGSTFIYNPEDFRVFYEDHGNLSHTPSGYATLDSLPKYDFLNTQDFASSHRRVVASETKLRNHLENIPKDYRKNDDTNSMVSIGKDKYITQLPRVSHNISGNRTFKTDIGVSPSESVGSDKYLMQRHVRDTTNNRIDPSATRRADYTKNLDTAPGTRKGHGVKGILRVGSKTLKLDDLDKQDYINVIRSIKSSSAVEIPINDAGNIRPVKIRDYKYKVVDVPNLRGRGTSKAIVLTVDQKLKDKPSVELIIHSNVESVPKSVTHVDAEVKKTNRSYVDVSSMKTSSVKKTTDPDKVQLRELRRPDGSTTIHSSFGGDLKSSNLPDRSGNYSHVRMKDNAYKYVQSNATDEKSMGAGDVYAVDSRTRESNLPETSLVTPINELLSSSLKGESTTTKKRMAPSLYTSVSSQGPIRVSQHELYDKMFGDGMDMSSFRRTEKVLG